MTRAFLLAGLPALLLLPTSLAGAQLADKDTSAAKPALAAPEARPAAESLRLHIETRLETDLAALERYRPSYSFWSNVFTTRDGSVVFGSARDGRLLATLPVRGDWSREGLWEEPSLAELIRVESLPGRLSDRRDRVAAILEAVDLPVVHNPTRGDFFLPNARLYGSFVGEWADIYERFGVPAELGLAQALVESGLAGKVKSEAGAIGFCQWLRPNWKRLDGLTSWTIESQNQTTQAAFCAAYLTVLATKYGSFIPALSEHHAGGANVGRTVINGSRLGGEDIRDRYLLGGALARDLRVLSPRTYRAVVGTYGPRSFLYSEMVFGNMGTIRSLREDRPQERIVAMRAPRAISLDEVVRRSGLTVAEVRRFNPALVRQVPRGATLYLPDHIPAFGADVSFWHRPAPESFTAVLDEFVRLEAPLERWEDPDFEAVLRDFRRRFRDTDCEEGRVMDAALGYVMQELPLNRRVLSAFRADRKVERLFEEGVRLRESSAR